MAIAGAVVVPVKKEYEEKLRNRLNSLNGVDVQDIGINGIAVVLEETDTERLKKLSGEINEWEEVIDFQLSYLNWEEVEETIKEIEG